MEACAELDGWVAEATDDDGCTTCFPGATELCDGFDNDCDRVEDDGLLTSRRPCVPGQMEWFETVIAGVPAAVDYDYDCDGVETKEHTYMVRTSAYQACSEIGEFCHYAGPAWPNLVGGPPECGVVEDLNQCFAGCMSAWAPYRQRCR